MQPTMSASRSERVQSLWLSLGYFSHPMTEKKKKSYKARCQYTLLSLILLKAPVEKIEGKIVVRENHLFPFFKSWILHSLPGTTCWGEQKVLTGAESCDRAALRGLLTFWTVCEKCKARSSKRLCFWRCRIDLDLKSARTCAAFSKKIIWIFIK